MKHGYQKERDAVVLLAVLYMVCCGLPLLLLSSISLASIYAHWPVLAAALVVLGAVGFAWVRKRSCSTCLRDEQTA